MSLMKILTGTVTGGRIELPPDAFAEGDRVVVLALDSEELVRLTPEQQQEILEAVEDVRQGNYIDGEELLAELRALDSR